ncbi:transglutaminase family protein [Qipengyuania gaetbuli]|uniref:transglutaminase-like domain-containing protein n=1 Tax=Qipengyuania gaetbuli TaxID=266952 RepID=UPI001C9A1B0A|nr:transglutaminase family protein [Qipengyuania gaetbuli]MBY6014199.1 transglutaminase family protein [Qipengyuania gaetbuli]
MAIQIYSSFAFSLETTTDVLLQFEAAAIPEQSLVISETEITPTEDRASVPAQDDIGNRIWLRAQGKVEVSYRAQVELRRKVADLAALGVLQPHDLPGEAVEYLFDSRYCPADRFQAFVETEFAGTEGGVRVAAIRDWIAGKFSYTPGSSDPQTTALDSFVERRGICRDYAHTLVAMARASAIPARYVACYAPGVEPQDFHAVAEVFLADPTREGAGTWQLVDATGMADPTETVKIGVGRDAADVSFLTSFGPSDFIRSSVAVSKA